LDTLIGWNVPTPDAPGAAMSAEAPLLQSQLERLARQLTVLHTAAVRRLEALPQPSKINEP
ncbi:hypothetical protein HRD49_26150, partial [Corallococcus exiguus]